MSARLVSLDLATTAGWAYYADGELQASGFKRLGKVGDPWARLRAALDWLPELLAPVAWGRGGVVYERPLTMGRNRAAAVSALQLETALVLACVSRGVPEASVVSYALTTVKKHATGSGKAKKPEVIAAMQARWVRPWLADDNEADALAVLSLHLSRTT